jgi:hypothetical protein
MNENYRTKINELFEQYAAEMRLGVYLDVSKVDEFRCASDCEDVGATFACVVSCF